MSFSAETVAQQSQPRKLSPIQQEEPARLEPAQASITRSRVYTFVGKTGFGHDHGIEGKLKSGHLHLGATTDAGEIVFDLNSFDADTDRARRYVGLQGSTDASTRQQVNANMLGASVLDVRRYPTATFIVNSARPLDRKTEDGHDVYELEGKFTLHGTTRPLKISVGTVEKDGLINIRGSFAILQTQYGITPYSKALGAVGVSDKLTIHGDLWIAGEGRTDDAVER
jgi:polyisoprenoid-binding protein YceI